MMIRAVLLSALVAGLSVAQAPPENPDSQSSPAPQRLSNDDLSNLVAPVALYPDLLLSQVLAASTYPAEITEARQWTQQNPGLRGQQLLDAAKQQNWDPSVQALVAFPDVMNLLTRDIQWTTALGNAFLSQQADVMDAIQRLRASARDNGRLTNTPQQRVTYEQQNGDNAIVIQPTDPQMVYPPVYNPVYVWGPPAYGYYPPLGYPSPGYGVGFGVGTFLGGLFSGLLNFGGWGWGLSWLSHGLFLNGLFFSHFGFHGYYGPAYATHVAWSHNPGHRMGVPYGNRYAAGGHGWNSGRSSRAYAGSSYHASNRQMEAYRGLSASAARSGRYNNSGSEYRGGNRGYSEGHYSTPSRETARNYARAGGGNAGRNSGHGWASPSSNYRAARNSGGRSKAPHYSAPKSSRHSGGGGHSGGHGHSGGGHSHSGSHSHKK